MLHRGGLNPLRQDCIEPANACTARARLKCRTTANRSFVCISCVTGNDFGMVYNIESRRKSTNEIRFESKKTHRQRRNVGEPIKLRKIRKSGKSRDSSKFDGFQSIQTLKKLRKLRKSRKSKQQYVWF